MRRGMCPRRVLSFLVFVIVAGGDGSPGLADDPESGPGCVVRLHLGFSIAHLRRSHRPLPSAKRTGAHVFRGCTTGGVKQKGGIRGEQRVVAISAPQAFMAPLVFVSVIVLRKVNRRGRVHFRQLNKRFQHEIARWS